MENNYGYVQEEQEKKGSILGGVIGAILGAVLGAVLWCIVSVGTEKIYSMIGLAVGAIVGFGYDLFKGRKGAARIATVLVCVILSVVCGTVATYSWWLHEEYLEEVEFINTATKQELAEAYLSAEELEELNSYPEFLKKMALESFEVTLGTEAEFFQVVFEDPEFTSDLLTECGSSIVFALLGSIAFIVNGGKKKLPDKAVNFDEAASGMENVPAQVEPTDSDQDMQA